MYYNKFNQGDCMKDLTNLIKGVVCKKNLGYKYHRFSHNTNTPFYTKALNISKNDVDVAKNILKIIQINNREDMFLGLTSIALLSSYEKRKMLSAKYLNKELAKNVCEDNLYLYKACVNDIIVQGLKKDLDFSFCVKKDNKNLEVTYVELAGVQFSFHLGNTSKTALFAQNNNFRQYKDLEWNRKITFQNGAKEIFLYALHLKNTSNLRFINERPIDYARSINPEMYNKNENIF